MKESDLRRLLPGGIADFKDWHAQISKYNTPLMRHLDSLDIPEKKENWTRTALYEIVLWELDRFHQSGDISDHEPAECACRHAGCHVSRTAVEAGQRLL